jgi:hypothetical protein
MLQQQHQSQESTLSDFLLTRQQRGELSGADKETAAGRIAIGKAGGGCTEITLDRLIDRQRMLQQQHQSQESTLSDFLLTRQQRGELSESVNIAALGSIQPR